MTDQERQQFLAAVDALLAEWDAGHRGDPFVLTGRAAHRARLPEWIIHQAYWELRRRGYLTPR